MKTKLYYFNVILAAEGDNPDDAWNDAVEHFHLEPGECPKDYRTEEWCDECGMEWKNCVCDNRDIGDYADYLYDMEKEKKMDKLANDG